MLRQGDLQAMIGRNSDCSSAVYCCDWSGDDISAAARVVNRDARACGGTVTIVIGTGILHTVRAQLSKRTLMSSENEMRGRCGPPDDT